METDDVLGQLAKMVEKHGPPEQLVMSSGKVMKNLCMLASLGGLITTICRGGGPDADDLDDFIRRAKEAAEMTLDDSKEVINFIESLMKTGRPDADAELDRLRREHD